MSEQKFIDGMFVKGPRQGAPDFVKGQISINEKFIQYFNENKNEAGYVNIDLLVSQKGELYGKKNDWKPKQQASNQAPENKPNDDFQDLPF